jgi:hypothetical protein
VACHRPDEGDIVLDRSAVAERPFTPGKKLKREWIGIDITHLGISLIEKNV